MVEEKGALTIPWHDGKRAEVDEIVELYLRGRSIGNLDADDEDVENGSPSFSKSDKSFGISKNFAINLTDSVENLVTYASQRNDLNVHEEQYVSLKTFLAACNGAYRAELLSILFPIFTVFVIDLLELEQQTLAITFFNKYSCDHEEFHKSELERILRLLNRNDSTHVSLAEIKSKRFSLDLSGKIFGYLIQHLRNNNHSLLLQAINKNLDIRTFEGSKVDIDDQDNNVNEDKNQPTDNDDDDVEVRCLKESLEKIEHVNKVKPSITLYSFANAFQGLSAVKFSPSNNVICAGFEDSSVRLWSLNVKKIGQTKQREASSMKPGGSSNTESSANESIRLRGHKGTVFAVEFLPEGSAILSASEDTSVRLWSVQSQTSLVEYKGHDYPVWDVSTGCKGSYFVSASQDRTARLWSTEYAFPLRIFAGHQDSVDCVQFHPNGNYIVSGSSDKTCRLWDMQAGQFVRVFVGHQAAIYTTCFSPDGTYLASAGEDNKVLVWDIRNGKILKDLKGHSDTLFSVAFSKDGSLLVSGGLDNSIRVWNAEAVLKQGIASTNQSSNDSLACLINAYSTKSTSILEMQFSQGNLLLAAGLHEAR